MSLGSSEGLFVVGGRLRETCCSGEESDFGTVSSGLVVVLEVSSSTVDAGSG